MNRAVCLPRCHCVGSTSPILGVMFPSINSVFQKVNSSWQSSQTKQSIFCLLFKHSCISEKFSEKYFVLICQMESDNYERCFHPHRSLMGMEKFFLGGRKDGGHRAVNCRTFSIFSISSSCPLNARKTNSSPHLPRHSKIFTQIKKENKWSGERGGRLPWQSSC